MAKKSKTKKTKKQQKKRWSMPDFSDERYTMLAGVAFILCSIYLFVALISYFFTWQVDQDKVYRFSWSILLQPDVHMANALGRLGAFASHICMYAGIGISSFVLVYGLAFEGLKRLTINTWKRRKPYRAMFLIAFILPVILSTVLSYDDFPWCGAYGKAMVSWFGGFLVTIGLYVFLFAVVTDVGCWLFTPKL